MHRFQTFTTHMKSLAIAGLAGLLAACAANTAVDPTAVTAAVSSDELPVSAEAHDTGLEANGEMADISNGAAGDQDEAAGSAADATEVSENVSEDAVSITGDVIWIQRRLKDLGYYSGPIDGDAGGATRRAIKDYQTDQGLVTTGRPTPEFQEFLWRNGG